MRIAIVGAGAMGGLFGGCLAGAGQDAWLIDRAGPHLDAMRRGGLRLQTDAGDRTVPVQAGEARDVTGVCDLLIVFTKGPQTVDAVTSVAHLAGPQTRVLTVQNGLGNAERIAQALPGRPVLVGMTSWPADLVAPGHVVSHGHGEVRFWTADGTADPLVPALAAILAQAGLGGVADPAVQVAIWEKVAFNAAMNSVSAAARLAVGPIGDSPAGRALVSAIVEEAAAVALARGVAVDAGRVHAAVARAFAGHRGHKASMLQDVLAGRPTEIEQINGAIVQFGESLGVPTPVTRVLRDLVRLVDSAIPAQVSAGLAPVPVPAGAPRG